ncbi:hypothetical protein DRE_04867 [Drechslerella stenobrocha 248]|uniref:YCII-related domain-containing protein n=1 Tax=Drechslerella stenobrocha 248 TaxID=1043628 RepID=W7I9Y1_9PEZI|nr:hypothetical protein DRE_04867 [Drechslerella stenobrocha 248]
MSASAPATQNEWLVILPDKPDAVDRRLAVRPQHLKAALARAEEGTINFGGIMLHEHMVDGEKPKFKGSIMLLQVPTKEDVLEIIKSDIYVENDVWDLEKMEIHPFRSALRKAL